MKALPPISTLLRPNGRTHIKLLGDSLTQGMGNHGYIGYIRKEGERAFSVRGNGPDYPLRDARYTEGEYLGADCERVWYTSPCASGYAQLLKARLEERFDCSVKCYGMSGIHSGELATLSAPLVSEEDDVLFLMIGTNDRVRRTKERLFASVSAFIRNQREKGKTVLLLAPPPVAAANDFWCQYPVKEVGEVLQAVAEEEDVPFFSFYAPFIAACEAAGTPVDALFPDGLHPSDEGYRLMARLLFSALGMEE